MSWLLWMLACSEPAKYADEDTEPAPVETVVDSGAPADDLDADLLDLDAAWLRRVSFDLRGIPPSEDDLDALKDDPDAWRGLRDGYLQDARLNERLVHIFAERWHTRVDVFDIEVYDYGLPAVLEYQFERAVGEEPLRIMSRVVTEDLPWTEVVLGDWTMAEEVLASVWPLSYPADQTGWAVAEYTDGRPGVGVLATNGLWWRYNTDESNMNRRRAAAISKLLLCEDYLVRPVAFSEANTTSEATADAVHSDPYCLACHASLDPVAASLFGFWWLSLYSEIEETTYHPEREALWEQFLGVEPAWFGTPISGLPDLGVSIARDSRFYTCAVETFAEPLWRRPVTAADGDQLESLRAEFLANDLSGKTLLSALTETAPYRDVTPRMLTHDQLNSTIEALTGFKWTFDGFDQLDSDLPKGHRLLLGGVDGEAIRTPQRTPGFTWALVVKRAAEAAASTVVIRELMQDEERIMLLTVTQSDRPGDDAFTQELESLHRRLYSTPADAAWIADIETLWTEVADSNPVTMAWQTVLTVMLRDPLLLTY